MSNRYQRRMDAATRRVTVRRLSVPCWLLLVLGLAAMMAQSLAVHAHSHAAASLLLSANVTDGGASGASDADAPHAPAPRQAPGDDPDCPICKQSYSGGQFVAPCSALFALPAFVNVRVVRFVERAPPGRLLSHSWQTRAPPSA